MKSEVLCTVTTITPCAWQDKIREIDQLGLKKVAVFVSNLKKSERMELAERLEQTGLMEVPFVHMRNDMSPLELDYWQERWHTQVFNTHSADQYPMIYDFSQYLDKMYIENILEPLKEDEVKSFAGLCLDFSHLEAIKHKNIDDYNHNFDIFSRYPIGCGHMSAIKPSASVDKFSKMLRYDSHVMSDFREFDYVRNFSNNFFPRYIAIEIENSLAEQMAVKSYLDNILTEKGVLHD